MANVFTPRLPSGGRVTFDMSRVQFVTPIPRRKGGSGVVSIDGKEYTVNAAPASVKSYGPRAFWLASANTCMSRFPARSRSRQR